MELDTAFMYGSGETEQHLGALQVGTAGFTIATKVNPFKFQPQPVEVGLRPEQIREQFAYSLKSLNVESVDMLYLHAPDPTVPIDKTLQAVHELHQAGKFKRFGLSNYSSWQVAEIYYICKANGWVLPQVYQGMYNAVTRQVEGELFPCLRRFNMAFYAYNPLAGGILTGRYNTIDEQPAEGVSIGEGESQWRAVSWHAKRDLVHPSHRSIPNHWRVEQGLQGPLLEAGALRHGGAAKNSLRRRQHHAGRCGAPLDGAPLGHGWPLRRQNHLGCLVGRARSAKHCRLSPRAIAPGYSGHFRCWLASPSRQLSQLLPLKNESGQLLDSSCLTFCPNINK